MTEWKLVPVEPTPDQIDAGAQRLASFEDGSVWPDSWSPLQVAAMRNDAERVWRSMWLAAPEPPADERDAEIERLKGDFTRLQAAHTLACKFVAERDAKIKQLQEAAKRVDGLPPGVWQVWTSCSFRRISRVGGGDGDVLCAVIQQADGHPDLSWNERQCQALCDLVNGLRQALRGDATNPPDS
jgi:hypothetical protein